MLGVLCYFHLTEHMYNVKLIVEVRLKSRIITDNLKEVLFNKNRS